MNYPSLIFVFLLCAMPCLAMEIKQVDRQFIETNLFTYKNYLIGDSNANIFTMGEEIEAEYLGENFIVSLKSDKHEVGNRFKVVFYYKTDKSDRLENLEQDLKLNKRAEKIKFSFPSQFVIERGRIELWKVEVFDVDTLVTLVKSQGYVREFDFSSQNTGN